MFKLFQRKKVLYSMVNHSDIGKQHIITDVEVYNPVTGLMMKVKGVWDTGSVRSSITRRLADVLGFIPDKDITTRVHTVSGYITSHVYEVHLIFGDADVQVWANDCDVLVDGVSVLIGLDVISKGDFSITNIDSRTEMKFRLPTQGHIGK